MLHILKNMTLLNNLIINLSKFKFMKRKDYENYKWYPLTDEEYWIEEMQNEFPNCVTIVYSNQKIMFSFFKYVSC